MVTTTVSFDRSMTPQATVEFPYTPDETMRGHALDLAHAAIVQALMFARDDL